MSKTIYLNEYRRLIDELREARERSGMNQSTFAEVLGRSQQWVSLMERGSRRLDVVEFVDICRVLKIDPQTLLDPLMSRLSESGRTRSKKLAKH